MKLDIFSELQKAKPWPANHEKLVIDEALTHRDIAARVGASREMISRIFSDLAEGGYVRREDGHLIIARKPPPRW